MMMNDYLMRDSVGQLNLQLSVSKSTPHRKHGGKAASLGMAFI